MSKTTTTSTTTTTPTGTAAAAAADWNHPSSSASASTRPPHILINLGQPPDFDDSNFSTSSSSSTLNDRTMSSKYTAVHEEWASPIPQSTLRNSLSLHRPPFVHSTTNYHASSSTSSLPLVSSSSHAPYRDNDHVPSTKEEYPSSHSSGGNPSTNPYAQSFPPRTNGNSSRRQNAAGGPGGHSRQSSFGAWDSVSCRLLELKCKLCSKEGAIGRGLMIGWVLTTVGFLLACAFWKGELFTALDDLSKELYSLGYQGQLIFGFLIFVTTIPPLPLYSTLMVLCGYTFGVWEAFVVSYIASLTGAVVVFIVSRTLLRDVITKSLQNSPTAMSLLHILPSKPHLLLLIRVAPYPYNLLNVILASSPCLSLRTYTACTALSLCKLVLHTWIGAGLHDLSELHGAGAGAGDGKELSPEDQQRQDVRWYSTCFGVVLCISLFFYLTHLAKRAVAKAQTEHEAREVRCPGQGHVFLREEDA